VRSGRAPIKKKGQAAPGEPLPDEVEQIPEAASQPPPQPSMTPDTTGQLRMVEDPADKAQSAEAPQAPQPQADPQQLAQTAASPAPAAPQQEGMSPVTSLPVDPARSFVDQLVQQHQQRQPQQAQQPTAQGQQKQADVARALRRNQYLMVTPDNQVIARRLPHRRFTFPEAGVGKPAPYEHPVRIFPEGGVPDEGYHGYEIGLNVGESPDIPEGFEVLSPNDVLKDLYASMGMPANRQFRKIDRARARALLRFLKKRKRQQAG